jgi:hypothetical protein
VNQAKDTLELKLEQTRAELKDLKQKLASEETKISSEGV